MTHISEQQAMTWVKVKEFEEKGIVISVSCLHLRKPRFSYEVGVRVNGGKFGRFFPVLAQGQGRIEIVPTETDVLTKLIGEAQAWIKSQYQEAEDAAIEQRIQREQSQVNRDKPRHKPGIKTLGKADAANKAVIAEALETWKKPEGESLAPKASGTPATAEGHSDE